MEFKVVDVPATSSENSSSAVIQAMQDNIGKAISIPLGMRDANNLRKTLRAAIVTRGLLKVYTYKTKISNDGKELMVWFELVPEVKA